ncbi:MAG: FAD-dependent oxidoreductase [Halapricum sp.]
MTRVCVIGCGLAGAAATLELADTAEVTVFEADRIGGRMRSHERDGCRYDLGANYLELGDDELETIVTDAVGDVLQEIEPPVWRFDAGGDVVPDRSDQHTRWSAESGLEAIPRSMVERTDARVEEGTPVTALDRTESGWSVTAGDGTERFDGVILAVPAGATSLLTEIATWDDPAKARLHAAADSVPQRPMDTVALHYPFEIERPYFGVVSQEGVYDVAWVSLEASKPGRVPEGESVVVVQFGPSWATTHPRAEPAETAEAAADRAAELIDDERVAEPDWWDHQRWANAIPSRGPDIDVRTHALDHHLAIAGDWTEGIGRTRAAIRSGLAAGEELAGHL